MTPRRPPVRSRALLAVALSALLVAVALASPATAATETSAPVAHGAALAGQPGRTLVLYDTGGPWGWLGEVYATQTANLASRYGSWTARPVTDYTAGEMALYTAVVYIGSTYVRDGVASFYPFLGVGPLREIVTGVCGAGYTFVPAAATLSA